MKIKISQSVTTTKQVEKEIEVPSFWKEKGHLPSFYCILSENEYVKVYQSFTAIVHEPKGHREIAEFVESCAEATEQEFNEVFKKAINDLGQAAAKFATDYIIHVDSIPTDREIANPLI